MFTRSDLRSCSDHFPIHHSRATLSATRPSHCRPSSRSPHPSLSQDTPRCRRNDCTKCFFLQRQVRGRSWTKTFDGAGAGRVGFDCCQGIVDYKPAQTGQTGPSSLNRYGLSCWSHQMSLFTVPCSRPLQRLPGKCPQLHLIATAPSPFLVLSRSRWLSRCCCSSPAFVVVGFEVLKVAVVVADVASTNLVHLL